MTRPHVPAVGSVERRPAGGTARPSGMPGCKVGIGNSDERKEAAAMGEDG
jgi:hypothetical protein